MSTTNSRAAALRRINLLVGGALLVVGVVLLFLPKPWRWWEGLVVVLLAVYLLTIAAFAARIQRWWDTRRGL